MKRKLGNKWLILEYSSEIKEIAVLVQFSLFIISIATCLSNNISTAIKILSGIVFFIFYLYWLHTETWKIEIKEDNINYYSYFFLSKHCSAKDISKIEKDKKGNLKVIKGNNKLFSIGKYITNRELFVNNVKKYNPKVIIVEV